MEASPNTSSRCHATKSNAVMRVPSKSNTCWSPQPWEEEEGDDDAHRGKWANAGRAAPVADTPERTGARARFCKGDTLDKWRRALAQRPGTNGNHCERGTSRALRRRAAMSGDADDNDDKAFSMFFFCL